MMAWSRASPVPIGNHAQEIGFVSFKRAASAAPKHQKAAQLMAGKPWCDRRCPRPLG